MTRNLAQRIGIHMDVLVNQIGERPGGSPGCHRAEDYIERHFGRHGWAVERQVFSCPQWQEFETSLLLNGQPLTARANAYSPSCDVKATAVCAGTLSELESAELTGQIAVLYGALMPQPLSPKSWFLKSERDDRIIQLIEQKSPQAVITIQQIGAGLERLIEDWEFTIPSATITAEAGRDILQAGDPLLELRIDARMAPGETANVVGRKGIHPRRVVICAHHDTKIDTPGACDNASGVAVVLALAETAQLDRFPFAVELVSFTNEEYLPIGDDEYLRRGGHDLSDVIACINIDGVGQWVAPDSITVLSAGKSFEKNLQKLADGWADIVWTDPWPESNHSTFAFRGVPSVAFTSAARIALAHHPHDDLSWSNAQRIARLAAAIEPILHLIAAHSDDWTRSG